MLGLATRWGVKGLDAYIAQLAKDFTATASDESKATVPSRIEAARQLIDLRKTDPGAAREVIALVTAKTQPELATGLIAAVMRSDSPEVGTALVDALGSMTPTARKASLVALLGKSDWTGILVAAIEEGKVPLSVLSLDQSQSLASHPDKVDRRTRQGRPRPGGRTPRPRPREGHPAARPHRPERWRRLARQGGLQARVRQVPHALRRGGQGRPGPHRHGRPPQERADRPHPRPEPIGRRELPPVHRLHHERSGPQRPARRARRRPQSTCSTPKERGRRSSATISTNSSLFEEVAHARRVREVDPRSGPGRPLAVPHAEGEVPAPRPQESRDGDHHQGDDVGRRGRHDPPDLRRLGAEDRRRRAVRARRPGGGPGAQRGHAQRPDRPTPAEDAEVGHLARQLVGQVRSISSAACPCSGSPRDARGPSR